MTTRTLRSLLAVAALACSKQAPPAPPAPPEVFGAVPAFTLQSQDGKPFGSSDLAGRPYVANTFFTACPSICPRLTKIMVSLQSRLADAGLDARLVSFTVDPETDTPDRLRRYGQQHGADFTRWTFLTGPMDAIRAVVTGGFMTHVGAKEPVGDVMDIAHTGKMVLVDAQGQVRGWFDSDEEGVAAVLDALRQLVAERPQ